MRTQSIGASLRPYARADAAGKVRWAVMLYPVTAVLAFFLLWLRRPQVLSAPHLWPQDGTVFYATYLIDGPIRSLFVPDNGFLALIPRLITAIVGSASALQIPAIFAAISLAGTALSCAFFALPQYRYFLRSDQIRIVCCLAFAAVPFVFDDLGSLASLSWYACIPAMLLLALPRRGYNGRASWFMLGASILVVLVALSAPGIVVLAPLAFVKIYRGTSRVRIVSGAFLCGIIVQFMVSRVVSHPNVSAVNPSALAADILNVGAYQIILDNALGHSASSALSSGHVVALSTFTCIVALVGALLFIETRKKVMLARRLVYIVCAGIACVIIACFSNATSDLNTPARSFDAWHQLRYLFIPIALLYYFVARICDDLLRARAREPFRALAFASFVTIALISNFRLSPLEDDEWASHAALIDGWRAASAAGKTHSALDLPIDPAGWTLSLPALQAVP